MTFAIEDVQLLATTRTLGAQTMDLLLRKEGDTYFFDGAATEVAALQPDDIIISSAGEGFLRRVVATSASATEIAVETADASLEDAIERGTLYYSDGSSGLSGSQWVFTAGASDATCVISELRCTVPFNQLLQDGIVLTGQVSFDADVDFSVSYGGWEIDCFCSPVQELRSVTTFELDAEVRLVTSAGFSFSGEVTIPLGTATTLTPAGVLQLELALTLGVSGSADAGVQTIIMGNFETIAGGHYIRGQGWREITPRAEASFEVTVPSVSANGQVRAYARPVVTGKWNGVDGPYFSGEAYLRLDADTQRVPWWQLFGGIGLQAGVRTSLFGQSIVDFTLPFWEREWQLAEAERPTLVATPVETPTPISMSDLIDAEIEAKAQQDWKLSCPFADELVGSFDEVNDHWVVVFCPGPNVPFQELEDRFVIYERQGTSLVPLLNLQSGFQPAIHPFHIRLRSSISDLNGDGFGEVAIWRTAGCNGLECGRLLLYGVRGHSAFEVEVHLPTTGLLAGDNNGDGTSAVPGALEDLDGDGKQEIIATDGSWELRSFCHACSPGASFVLEWDGNQYVNRSERFLPFFDERITTLEDALAVAPTDTEVMRSAISILLNYGNSGRAAEGWARYHEIVDRVTSPCWLSLLSAFEQDLELSVPPDGASPNVAVTGSDLVRQASCND